MRSFFVAAALAGSMLTGCAVHQAQNTPVWQNLERDPVSGSSYWIYKPSTYRCDRPSPVIVSCHGTPPFDVAEHHIREWKMLAERNGCIVVTPSLSGTDGLIGNGPLVGMLTCERSILSIVAQLGYRYNIDRANIMITGFSGGGFPTYWVGLRHPEVFSVVVARSCNFNRGNLDGWMPLAARHTRVKVYYGGNDPGAISSQSKQAVRYLRGKGLTVETQVLPDVGHERHPEVAMAFFRKHMNPPVATMAVMPRRVAGTAAIGAAAE
jgi:poly(3-hydroxybutyrate) depolymerase